MKRTILTPREKSVLNAVKKGPLTSSQILNKVDGVNMILVLYNILDKLKKKGALKSYSDKNQKFHIAC